MKSVFTSLARRSLPLCLSVGFSFAAQAEVPETNLFENASAAMGEIGMATLMVPGGQGAAVVYQNLNLSGKSYEMEISFMRAKGKDGFGVVFPVGEQKVTAVFGGWGGKWDGLNRVNGTDPNNKKNPTQRSSKLVNGEVLNVRIVVKPSSILEVYANGELHYSLNEPNKAKLELVGHIANNLKGEEGLYIVYGTAIVTKWTVKETSD